MNRVSRSTEKFNLLFLVFVWATAIVVALLSSCSQPSGKLSYEPNSTFPQEFSGFAAGRKLYVTSIGQSKDIMIFTLRLDKAVEGVQYTDNQLLEADEVEMGALVFAIVGSSLKGLAEGGLTKESETERAKKFAEASKSGKFELVSWHIGGVLRRGTTSDGFIELLFANSRLALFSQEGNEDGALSDCARKYGVPYCQYDASMTQILNKLFGREGANV